MSKALFKQSCKANGVMWIIITAATCFMLACVMLISGNGNITGTKDAIEDTIIVNEIDSAAEERAINYYTIQTDGLAHFDAFFVPAAHEVLEYTGLGSALAADAADAADATDEGEASASGKEDGSQETVMEWYSSMPSQTAGQTDDEYERAVITWKGSMPKPLGDSSAYFAGYIESWLDDMPDIKEYADNSVGYKTAVFQWKLQSPLLSQEKMVRSAFTMAVEELEEYIFEEAAALDEEYTPESDEAQEMLGCVMYALNPEGQFDDFYTANGEEPPADYDVASIITALIGGDSTYIRTAERAGYIADRAEFCASVFLAGNLVLEENIDKIVAELDAYGVTREKYDSFGYTYEKLYDSARTTIISFRYKYDYEAGLLADQLAAGSITEEEYAAKLAEMNASLTQEIAGSLLAVLPAEVADVLEELGQMDLYSLIVGSIFYKLAGLLLPIIYMIMASNNLISGQVDSGSMAYVLSSGTKRRSVVLTQALFLIGSLFAMFCCTTITGLICLACINVELTYGQLLLLNLGAFLVLFTLSGLCFATSCFFDRSKRSMAIGGGLSIFALVAAMLGLFGSPVIPSIIRLTSLNFFNYVTVISLFDVVSVIDLTTNFIWKMTILLVLGIIGYIAGSVRFVKKDLPL